ncbi:DUF3331 domain-containing protein [Paraburkholderia caledonica]|jgi:hypothetical protein|uniref:DUF3331 domain-containing protein n=1 Tax=Paraburkholderia caledonica TaxID=134536 RepID=UPI0038B89EB7
MCRVDPWPQIIDRLDSCSRGTGLPDPKAPERENRGSRAIVTFPVRRPLTISHIEWKTETTVLVSWCDATRGSYLDQTWRICYARSRTICALSGSLVRRRDLVFKPSYRGAPPPSNASDVILASVLRRLIEERCAPT